MININNEIGVYDSGVGGLTVLKELIKYLPNEKYIYFGDLKNLPYGEKSEEELLEIGKKIFDFFEQKKVKAVVMACNTTSALLYDKIKDNYSFKIYPVIQTVAKFLAEQNVNKLGIFATEATINSHAYKNNVKKFNPNIEIFEQACPQWVKIVESGNFNDKNIEIIKNDLQKMLGNNPQKIVLGCTHYPYLTKILSQFANENLFINPATNFAQLIANDMKNLEIISDKNKLSKTFYVSQSPEQFVKASKMFFELQETPVLINI